MNDVINKLVPIESSAALEKGPFDLFALFSSEDESEDRWDLVVAASWIQADYSAALDYLNKRLQAELTLVEFLSISKVAILDVYDKRVKDILEHCTTEHKVVLLRDYRFNGSRVDRIYLITSKQQVDPVLLHSVWELLTEWRNQGHEKIRSEEILKATESRGHIIKDYALDRVIEYLIGSHCIKAVQHIDSEGIKRHGAAVITSVDVGCHPPPIPESHELLGAASLA